MVRFAAIVAFMFALTAHAAAQQQVPVAPSPKNAPVNQQLPPTKKSNTGICHAPGTTYYARTTHFTPFGTLEDCLKSGGRLPKR